MVHAISITATSRINQPVIASGTQKKSKIRLYCCIFHENRKNHRPAFERTFYILTLLSSHTSTHSDHVPWMMMMMMMTLNVRRLPYQEPLYMRWTMAMTMSSWLVNVVVVIRPQVHRWIAFDVLLAATVAASSRKGVVPIVIWTMTVVPFVVHPWRAFGLQEIFLHVDYWHCC